MSLIFLPFLDLATSIKENFQVSYSMISVSHFSFSICGIRQRQRLACVAQLMFWYLLSPYVAPFKLHFSNGKLQVPQERLLNAIFAGSSFHPFSVSNIA